MKNRISLRRQIVFILLISWLVPVIMLCAMMLTYLSSVAGEKAEDNYTGQFTVHLRMCTDRINSAVEASRLASYDSTIRDAWHQYEKDGNWASLYRKTRSFLNRQYQSDSRFRYAAFWFSQDPEKMMLTTTNSSTGEMYRNTSTWWEEDFPAVLSLASSLDTAVGFHEAEGRVYLVRNLMDSDFKPIGVLALALNNSYYFDDLEALTWAKPVRMRLGEAEFTLAGEDFPDRKRGLISAYAEGNGYVLEADSALVYRVLLAPVRSYALALGIMLALLVPLLICIFSFFRRKVTRPMQVLTGAAARIEKGELGYRIESEANTSDFSYLYENFNRMSGQLESLFDRIWREEIALRDARIKALQAHINPHFLNNTLEIINWEARMGGNESVSRMIEALSLVLDAALDRKKEPEVPLREELGYVDAYLYIITQRFGDRLHVSFDIPEPLKDCMVPRLILQPVIENAVEHGIGALGRGRIALRAYREGDSLILEVINDGGMSCQDEEQIARLLSSNPDTGNTSSRNIGIANVNQRLKMLYGPSSGLTISPGKDNLVIARLTISALKAAKEIQ